MIKLSNIKKVFLSVLMIFMVVVVAPAKEYHVSVKKGNDSNIGSVSKPFKSISEAAKHAYPGDTITVHTGVYREWVNPIRGGESDEKRIVYRAAPGEKVEIKGSEIITGWKRIKGSVWKVIIPNTFFKNYNPYKDSISGDWFHRLGRIHHTGEVFLNGKSLYEKESIDLVNEPIANDKIDDPEGSTYTWYTENDSVNTTIWANFQKFNPKKELVEMTTRRTVFYPETPGINYLTIKGFYMSQAATQWAAPTAEQIGLISTHWNKGWIIENNIISDSKCSGITLGKERSTGQNVWSNDKSIDGSNHYIEVTFNTLRNGWNKDNIGSHIVRNNTIFNCEQTAICGSMGAAFSVIENNYIYDVYTKRQFSGFEIAGIKFHAPIDTQIIGNRIQNSGRGIWLDWMTQGTRVSKNLLFENNMQDIFLEVNHGPFLIDNNILLSRINISTWSQGGAFVHNLIAGIVNVQKVPGRYTPYHLQHSTKISGLSTIQSGDDRYYNNIFIGDIDNEKNENYGLKAYVDFKFPVFINDNVYYSTASPYTQEDNYVEEPNYNPNIKLEKNEDEVYLNFNFNNSYKNIIPKIITTELLGSAKIPKATFENPDGTPLIIDSDYFGNLRSDKKNSVGPFNNLKSGNQAIKVW